MTIDRRKYLWRIKRLEIKSWLKYLMIEGKHVVDYVLGELTTGTNITIDNTVEKKFYKFDIKGNSIQDGTPTPETEVPIYSAGDDIQLFDKSTVTPNTRLSADGYPFADNNYFLTDYIPVKGNTTYKANSEFFNLYNRIAYYDENKSIISLNNGNDVDYFVTPANTKFVRFAKANNKLDTFKLVEGTSIGGYSPYGMGSISEKIVNKNLFDKNNFNYIDGKRLNDSGAVVNDATTYTAHQEQTYTIPCQQPMRSIGAVRDEFVQDTEGNWFERHNIGLGNRNSFYQALNITSTIGSDLYGFACNNALNIATNSELGAVISNIFEPKILGTAGDTTNVNNVRFNMGIAKHTSTSQIVITLKKTYLSEQTQSALFNFLDSKDFYFYYLLATPTDLPCTAEQISILENLPKSYNEQTNIYSIDTTPAYIEAQAYVKKVEE